ncbi:TraR/DksA family transcriptional regulator [Nocardioides yefusunii]|uniref:TraR/DksA family transcriptional regulator n=1 Tax=Nocardioides yefusunii TaxID=2500546 RepID=A0ABW1QUT6_9ACTN|nr:TraR/DksA family transcriptional regulator [Nocardioides yefusunii]
MASTTSTRDASTTVSGPAATGKNVRVPRRRRPKVSEKLLAGLAHKPDESAWTAEEVVEVLDALDEHRTRAEGLLAVLEHEVNGLMKDAGDGAGQDQADVGSTTLERDQELQLMAAERATLDQVERAWERVLDGTFGTCENCEEPIGKLRAMAFPRATLCIDCKQRQERR